MFQEKKNTHTGGTLILNHQSSHENLSKQYNENNWRYKFFFPQKNDPKIFINIFYDRIHRKVPLGKNLFTEAMRGKNCVIIKLQRINLLGY